MGKIIADLLIERASELVTVRGFTNAPAHGEMMREAGIIKDGSIAVSNGRIIAVGGHDEVLAQIELSDEAMVIDAHGMTVLPGFIDAHTHLVYAGSREHELAWKISGIAYLEILERGGGILNTVGKTRAASNEELLKQAYRRANQMLAFGTTTVEAKSGYGLTTFDELRSLEILGELNRAHPLDIIPTFMGAHAYPPEYKGCKDKFVNLICEEMLPAVAEQGVARFCDVFCEEGVFDVDSSREILKRGMGLGLKGKIHADELAASGGSRLAAELKTVSADHLLEIDKDGMRGLAANGVVGVLLPATSFNLAHHKYAPARKMLGHGMALALATDANPGSAPNESMQFVLTLACLYLKMSPAEALVAATINSAHAIGMADRVGSLEVGKSADILIMNSPNHEYLPYHFGGNHVAKVIKNGKVVVK